jgi:hypothetical protein
VNASATDYQAFIKIDGPAGSSVSLRYAENPTTDNNPYAAFVPPGHLFLQVTRAGFNSGPKTTFTDLGPLGDLAVGTSVKELALRAQDDGTGLVRVQVHTGEVGDALALVHDGTYVFSDWGANLGELDCNLYAAWLLDPWVYAELQGDPTLDDSPGPRWSVSRVTYHEALYYTIPDAREYRDHEWEQRWGGPYSDLAGAGSFAPAVDGSTTASAWGWNLGFPSDDNTFGLRNDAYRLWGTRQGDTLAASALSVDFLHAEPEPIQVQFTYDLTAPATSYFRARQPSGQFAPGATVTAQFRYRKTSSSLDAINVIRVNGALVGAGVASGTSWTSVSMTATADSNGDVTFDVGTFNEGSGALSGTVDVTDMYLFA